jgi:hypothetical protein
MRILTKEELWQYKKDKIENFYQLREQWLDKAWITSTQFEVITQKIKALNVAHHNELEFEQKFIELFTDNDRKVQTIDRSKIGGYLGGIELSSKIQLFTETLEYGINIYVVSEQINEKNIAQVIESIYFLIDAVRNPELAKKEMNASKLQNQLENDLKVNNNTISHIIKM